MKTKVDLNKIFRISLHDCKDKAIIENCKKILRGAKKMASSCPGVAFATPCHPMATGLKSGLEVPLISLPNQQYETIFDEKRASYSYRNVLNYLKWSQTLSADLKHFMEL